MPAQKPRPSEGAPGRSLPPHSLGLENGACTGPPRPPACRAGARLSVTLSLLCVLLRTRQRGWRPRGQRGLVHWALDGSLFLGTLLENRKSIAFVSPWTTYSSSPAFCTVQCRNGVTCRRPRPPWVPRFE